jgi:hypothetical protein
MLEVKNFVGQPVLSKILDVIPSSLIHKCFRSHNANRYYKKLPFRKHLGRIYTVFLATVMAYGS